MHTFPISIHLVLPMVLSYPLYFSSSCIQSSKKLSEISFLLFVVSRSVHLFSSFWSTSIKILKLMTQPRFNIMQQIYIISNPTKRKVKYVIIFPCNNVNLYKMTNSSLLLVYIQSPKIVEMLSK